jgi:hypothetical protein
MHLTKKQKVLVGMSRITHARMQGGNEAFEPGDREGLSHCTSRCFTALSMTALSRILLPPGVTLSAAKGLVIIAHGHDHAKAHAAGFGRGWSRAVEDDGAAHLILDGYGLYHQRTTEEACSLSTGRPSQAYPGLRLMPIGRPT